MKDNKKPRSLLPQQAGKDKRLEVFRSLKQYITEQLRCKARRREIICRLIEDFIFLYVMGASLWVICRLVGEILEKMGVG